MSAIMPQGELPRRALAWICEERERHPEKLLRQLLDEAGMRYNLSPKEQGMLLDFLAGDHTAPCGTAAGRTD